MSNHLRAVVIGAGQAGEGHTVALQNVGVEVAAMCSRTQLVVSEVAQRLGVRHASTDWRSTLESERPDIVAVATPASARVEPISAALELGCHVYTDKPLAVTAANARRLYELALKKGARTAVAANWMYDPGIAYLRELVATGSIGQPFAIESRFVSPWPFPSAAMWINRIAEGGGVLNNRMSHQLAAAQRIVGGEVLQVVGEARTHRRRRPSVGQPHDYRQWRTLSAEELVNVPWVEVDADDSCIVVARLGQPGARPEDTITANLYCCSSIRARDGRTMTIYGDEGSLQYDWVVDPAIDAAHGSRPYVLRTRFANADWHAEPVPERILQGLPQIAQGLHRDWAALAREFVADIRGEPYEPYPTFRQGWIYQEITEAIRNGSGWIAIPQNVAPTRYKNIRKEPRMNEMVGEYRVVDLSKKLYPGQEKRRLAVRRYFVEKTGDYHSEMDLMSHLGTHVESPYHYKDQWPDVLQLPVTNFVGRGVLLRLDNIAPRAWVRAADLDQADQGRVQEGDVVLLTSPYHSQPFVFNADDQRPNLGEEAAKWLAGKRVKALGWGDGVAIENDIDAGKILHEILMPQNVSFIEVMQNLDQLQDDIFLLVFTPLPIAGLDSCPARVVAIEGVPGFRTEENS